MDAKAKHEKWLRRMGVHPSQLREKKQKKPKEEWRKEYRRTLHVDGPVYTSVDTGGSANATTKKSIMDHLDRESASTRDEILRKAQCTAPICNKGGYQYITPNADLTDLGRKK